MQGTSMLSFIRFGQVAKKEKLSKKLLTTNDRELMMDDGH